MPVTDWPLTIAAAEPGSASGASGAGMVVVVVVVVDVAGVWVAPARRVATSLSSMPLSDDTATVSLVVGAVADGTFEAGASVELDDEGVVEDEVGVVVVVVLVVEVVVVVDPEDGITAEVADEYGLVPSVLTAATRNSYESPFVRPVTVRLV